MRILLCGWELWSFLKLLPDSVALKGEDKESDKNHDKRCCLVSVQANQAPCSAPSHRSQVFLLLFKRPSHRGHMSHSWLWHWAPYLSVRLMSKGESAQRRHLMTCDICPEVDVAVWRVGWSHDPVLRSVLGLPYAPAGKASRLEGLLSWGLSWTSPPLFYLLILLAHSWVEYAISSSLPPSCRQFPSTSALRRFFFLFVLTNFLIILLKKKKKIWGLPSPHLRIPPSLKEKKPQSCPQFHPWSWSQSVTHKRTFHTQSPEPREGHAVNRGGVQSHPCMQRHICLWPHSISWFPFLSCHQGMGPFLRRRRYAWDCAQVPKAVLFTWNLVIGRKWASSLWWEHHFNMAQSPSSFSREKSWLEMDSLVLNSALKGVAGAGGEVQPQGLALQWQGVASMWVLPISDHSGENRLFFRMGEGEGSRRHTIGWRGRPPREKIFLTREAITKIPSSSNLTHHKWWQPQTFPAISPLRGVRGKHYIPGFKSVNSEDTEICLPTQNPLLSSWVTQGM